MEYILTTDALTKTYKNFKALNGLDVYKRQHLYFALVPSLLLRPSLLLPLSPTYHQHLSQKHRSAVHLRPRCLDIWQTIHLLQNE